MPKVLSYTPAWLSRPSPGFDVFHSSDRKLSSKASEADNKDCEQKTRRTIAYRHTEYCNEIFVVIDNTVRWADLAQIKDDWEREQDEEGVIRSIESGGQENQKCYRVAMSSYCALIC